MNYVVDKVKGGVKRGCVHFDTPSFSCFLRLIFYTFSNLIRITEQRIATNAMRLF